MDIVEKIGKQYLVSNIENDEFSYAKALSSIGKNYKDYLTQDALRNYKDIDLRFVDKNLTILVETKQKLKDANFLKDITQLQNYVCLEKELTGNKIIAILISTTDGGFKIWQDGTDLINEDNWDKNERKIKSMSEYKNIHFGTRNDKIKVAQNTYQLNILLHNYGIGEKIRSQFVGTCLLALKNQLAYSIPSDKINEETGKKERVESMKTSQVIAGIEDILNRLLEGDLKRAEKLLILKKKVLESQDVTDLKIEQFQHILQEIERKILPYINDKNTAGQDLLNLFFTTFNKYVGKSDKNQAFTPDHIVHFMCRVVGVNRNSIVLDPCCGSGAFLVRALTDAMDDCDTEQEKDKVKQEQIYGFEFEDTAFGLATTNMLIHGDGNSNIKQGNCFSLLKNLNANVNTVLMNPPYNAQRKHSLPSYVETWSKTQKEDPSKGFHFVYEVAKKVKTGKMAVLLPMQCAISSASEIRKFKEKMLAEHTLDAVFSLPNDIFHPGASAVACCMIFNLGVRHDRAPIKKTFFGYFKDDGFEKRKNLGRVEKFDGAWQNIENKWLELYFNRHEEKGLSVTKEVGADDEWVAEAYMETDYSALKKQDFQDTLNRYVGFLLSNGKVSLVKDTTGKLNIQKQNNIEKTSLHEMKFTYFLGNGNLIKSWNVPYDKLSLNFFSKNCFDNEVFDLTKWKVFDYSKIFRIEKGFYNKKPTKVEDGDIPFLGATDKNNGVTEYYLIEDIESASKTGDENNVSIEEKLFEPHAVCVTNNGSVGFAYYQDTIFTCSHDVNPLYRKDGKFNKYTALFVATVIMLDRYRWQYGRKWRPKRMKESKLMLPATKDGKPDWVYMGQYIKSLINSEFL